MTQFGRPSTRSGMSHLCDSAVASLKVQRGNVLATRYRPFRYPYESVDVLKDPKPPIGRR